MERVTNLERHDYQRNTEAEFLCFLGLRLLWCGGKCLDYTLLA